MKRSIIALALLLASATSAWAGAYKNFSVAVYIPVANTRMLADPQRLGDDWARLSAQIKIDKVYIEVYRNHQWADEDSIEPIKKFFTDKGVKVSGGVTLAAGGQGGQFGTFDYEDPKDCAECQKAIELAARHFDQIVLDDFFFYTTKNDADIAAKGQRSWTDYRLARMREVAKTLVVGPAHAINPNARVIIKYPNWYEHFQGLGFDLDQEPHIFDGIYTGTETRDPGVTDEHLQAYESYEIIRYFNNIAPGRNGGGWVDTFSLRYSDRYSEQLFDMLLARAPEITLFSWGPVTGQPARPGERPWENVATSFDFAAIQKSGPGQGGQGGMTWARVAGYTLDQADAVLGKLGQPVGIASYKPYQSTGEDFLPHYLGMVGLPIELYPTFPTDAKLVLLTESAKFDPEIVTKIKAQLQAGKSVVITTGLLKALAGKGIEDIIEARYTDRIVSVSDYLGGFGAGTGTALAAVDAPNRPVLIPEVRFMTNDAWQIVHAVAADEGFPILLMDRYSKGILYILTIPENQGDLFNYPQPVLSGIKRQLLADSPVWIDSPAKVSLFAYDNHTFVIESYLPDETTVTVSLLPEFTKLRDLMSDEPISASATTRPGERIRRGNIEPARTTFTVSIKPHSYRVFEMGE